MTVETFRLSIMITIWVLLLLKIIADNLNP
jgi:hypothetical protein